MQQITFKEMQKYILKYNDNIKDIDKIERINDFYTKITANYDLFSGSGGGTLNKVENFVIKRDDKELKKYRQMKYEIEIVESSMKILKGKQKQLMDLYIYGYKLTYIRDRINLKSKAAAWNIKERAIKNMVKYANNNTKSNV